VIHRTRMHRGGEDDCVERRSRFEAEHPDVTIVTPGTHTGRWRAVVPAGQIPDDGTRTTVGARDLCGLMDQLEVIYPPAGNQSLTIRATPAPSALRCRRPYPRGRTLVSCECPGLLVRPRYGCAGKRGADSALYGHSERSVDDAGDQAIVCTGLISSNPATGRHRRDSTLAAVGSDEGEDATERVRTHRRKLCATE
jgi:hypothetical protein